MSTHISYHLIAIFCVCLVCYSKKLIRRFRVLLVANFYYQVLISVVRKRVLKCVTFGKLGFYVAHGVLVYSVLVIPFLHCLKPDVSES